MKKLLTTAAMALTVATAQADTGADFLALCENSSFSCEAKMTGYHFGLRMHEEQTGVRMSCLPPSIKVMDIADELVAMIKEHSELLEFDEGEIVMWGLIKLYPCEEQI